MPIEDEVATGLTWLLTFCSPGLSNKIDSSLTLAMAFDYTLSTGAGHLLSLRALPASRIRRKFSLICNVQIYDFCLLHVLGAL
jgi:hypothetical protein